MPTAELQTSTPSNTLLNATAIKARKRGPCLSRRTGQCGGVFQRGFPKLWNPKVNAFGRFYVDIPGCENRTRRVLSLGICPTRTIARRKLREFIEQEGINKSAYFVAAGTPTFTFREQAEIWIQALPTRRRRPVKPATIHGWQHALDKWILPTIGDLSVAEVSNAALKLLIDTMAAGGLAAKTIVSYTLVVKLVVASAVNSEGDQLYPRKWNHDFVGMPIVDKNKQPRPTVTEAQVATILANILPRYKPLFALLAGTGLRIGEALALKATDFSQDCRILSVQRSIWHGKEQEPKTPAAVRVIDIPEALAALMREYVAGIPSGYLFGTRKSNRPLGQRNLLRALHDAGVSTGFHAFRRFRTETLRRARAPEDLIGLWLGHARHNITDLYARGLQTDEAWRREWCERVGLGFSLNGLRGLQKIVEISTAQAA
jgi:integrase